MEFRAGQADALGKFDRSGEILEHGGQSPTDVGGPWVGGVGHDEPHDRVAGQDPADDLPAGGRVGRHTEGCRRVGIRRGSGLPALERVAKDGDLAGERGDGAGEPEAHSPGNDTSRVRHGCPYFP